MTETDKAWQDFRRWLESSGDLGGSSESSAELRKQFQEIKTELRAWGGEFRESIERLTSALRRIERYSTNIQDLINADSNAQEEFNEDFAERLTKLENASKTIPPHTHPEENAAKLAAPPKKKLLKTPTAVLESAQELAAAAAALKTEKGLESEVIKLDYYRPALELYQDPPLRPRERKLFTLTQGLASETRFLEQRTEAAHRNFLKLADQIEEHSLETVPVPREKKHRESCPKLPKVAQSL